MLHGSHLTPWKEHSISSRVANGICNLVTSCNMAQLMGSPTSDSTFTYQKGAKNTSFVDLLFSKGVMDSQSLHKISLISKGGA